MHDSVATHSTRGLDFNTSGATTPKLSIIDFIASVGSGGLGYAFIYHA